MRSIFAFLLVGLVLLMAACTSCAGHQNGKPPPWLADIGESLAVSVGPVALELAARRIETDAAVAEKPDVCLAGMLGAAALRAGGEWAADRTAVPERTIDVRACDLQLTPTEVDPLVWVIVDTVQASAEQAARANAKTCEGRQRAAIVIAEARHARTAIEAHLAEPTGYVTLPAVPIPPCDEAPAAVDE
jgi:hypothetical protein